MGDGRRHEWRVMLGALLLAASVGRAGSREDAAAALKQGDYAKAIPFLLDALRQGDDPWAVQNDLALASFLAGNCLDATMALETMNLRRPLDATRLNVLSECYHRLSTRDDLAEVFRDRALRICDSIVGMNPPEEIRKAVARREEALKLEARLQSEPMPVTEDIPSLPAAPPESVYRGVLAEFEAKWLARPPDRGGDDAVDVRELGLLADPAIVRFAASAGGVIDGQSRVSLRFFPTYPAAKEYLERIRQRFGPPDHEEAQPAGKFQFSFYGDCVIVSDKQGNVWGLIQCARR